MRHRVFLIFIAVVMMMVVATGCPKKKPRREHWACESPSGVPTTCWGTRWTFNQGPGGVDVALNTTYSESQLTFAIPGGGELTLFPSDTLIAYEAGLTLQTFEAEVDFDQNASTLLTAEKNDGHDWYVMAPTMGQAAFQSWVSSLGPDDTVVEVGYTVYADWGPPAPGCQMFDTYTVEIEGRQNAIDGYAPLDKVATTYGDTLTARLEYPLLEAPSSAFAGADPEVTRTELVFQAQDVAALAAQGHHSDALLKLNLKLRRYFDGDAGGDPADDWVLDASTRAELIVATDFYISEVTTASTACGN